ncbi:hypothetical protein RSOLAG1IB_08289 [Rhizoctonia solani AG-1 IB]|uniref:Uncharacterized protein n=1 Tax=Thanatephorus cucumeris (strain AG1-IB / isolate 7/3/14) TaxID=1108050 RepID=A0A0B7FGA2_THACB|nr:hypothetical protein RSOLAG1IB_08289 [Rhizoctonia solani AG-1 IB]
MRSHAKSHPTESVTKIAVFDTFTMEPTTRLTPDDRPTKRAKTEEPEESMNVPESNSAKKEEPAVDDLDDEDPYAGYEEKQENTRAADLYLDTLTAIEAGKPRGPRL